MAWNPHPDVSAARDFGEMKNADMVVIIYFVGDQVGYASWGITKNYCSRAKSVADRIFDYLLGVK